MGNENLQLNYKNNDTEKLKKVQDDSDMLDTVLYHLGGIGLGQKLMFLALLPFGFSFGFNYILQIFVTATPQNHWCRIPELANLSMELRRNLSAPGAVTGEWDQCMTFDANWTHVLEMLTPPSAETSTIPCQNGWEFEFSDIPHETVTTERQWVCDRAKYVPTAMSLYFFGSIVGINIFGWMADRFGRVPAIVGANLVGFIGGFATTFTCGVWDFLLCRFIAGLSNDNNFQIMFILVQEYVGPQYRTLTANLLLAFSCALGSTLLPWIAYYVADWRIFLYVTLLPTVIGILIAMFFLPESARWLVSRGRTKEAVAVLKKFEAINKRNIPDYVMSDFIISANKQKLNDEQSILHVFGSRPLREVIIKLMILFLGFALVVDGLVRVSGSLGSNLFAVVSVTSGAEIVIFLIIAITLDKFGRRTTISIFFSISGTLLLFAIFVPKGVILVVLAITSRFFMTSCAAATNQWSMEILPTSIRASGTSLLHMSTNVAIVFTPFIAYLDRWWTKLPMFIFTVVSFAMVGITLTLPETKGLPMPQNIADGEKIIRENLLCSKPNDDEEGPYKKALS